MSSILVSALLAALIGGLMTHLLVPVAVRVARAVRAVDEPGGRKQQAAAIPRLGGVAIAAGLAFGAIGVTMAQWNRWGLDVPRSGLVALALGTLMIFLLGLVDDILGVSVAMKFGVQILAAYLLVYVGWSFQVLRLPWLGDVYLGTSGEIVSVVWIVGVTNAINLLDGLDGLAGGVAAIIASGLLVFAVMQGDPLAVVLMAAMAGTCIGFLGHNWAPAKIFMGDSGSLTLGYLLAATSVHASLKAPAAVAILVPILALGLPVIDTLTVMVVRFFDQPHSPLGERILGMFRADRNHLHHALEEFTANRRRIVTWIYATVLAFCLGALAVAVTHNAALGVLLVAGEVGAVLMLRGLRKTNGGSRSSGARRVRPLRPRPVDGAEAAADNAAESPGRSRAAAP